MGVASIILPTRASTSLKGMTPGATELTVICGASALDNALVSMITPAFDAQFWSDNDLDHNGYIDEREWQFYQARNASENCLVAIRGGGRGDVTKSRVLWRYRKAIPNTSSPLLYRGTLYLIRDGIFSSIDPETGEPLKVARLTGALGNYWSSPVAADGKIFVTSEEGKIVTLNADPQWGIVSITNLEEEIFATPAIVDGRIYVRTRAALYCFARKPK